MTASLRLGFDIGGTFTDFVLADPRTGALHLHKTLTTPDDPAVGAMAGLHHIVAAHGAELADVAEIVHGTTLVTNAVIERKGARLGLITTRGFRDIIEAGTEQRYDIYDLFLTYPDPLVPRRRRLEVVERIDRDGRIVTPLDREGVRAAVRALRADGVEAIAIGFLNAYREPSHERQAAAIVAAEWPGVPVSVSSDVVAELGEYARFVTTCANAYVQPLMATYLRRLEQALRAAGFGGALRLMHSAGGLVSAEAAAAFPVRLLESGPAGGALAAALLGARAGHRDLLAFDMGGTTAKSCLVEDSRAQIAPMLEAGREHRFKKGSGLPIKAATIDMIEIGAGGGSIAAIDGVGLLRVGPRSAGAAPGPACYGKGGTEPTVTDANLLLGYYDPDFFLGGTMALDREAARAAIARVAEPLGLTVEQAAWGIHKVVVESMADAARVYLVERGKDPRRYAMVGFGGAGPAHAGEVARALGIGELVIPPASGAASALGFLAAPLSASRVRSMPFRLHEGADLAAAEALLRSLEAEARSELRDAQFAVERSADMRLQGQMHEIAVPLPPDALEAAGLAGLLRRFEDAYTARYAALQAIAAVEVVNFRVTVTGPAPHLAIGSPAATAAASRKADRLAWFGERFVPTPVYDRYALLDGTEIAGPAIVEEREATTIVAPGDTLRVDAAGNLRIAIAAASAMSLVEPGMSEAAARAAIEADPIALEIMWSRLTTVVDEMWLTIIRTAFSLIIAESQDFACELLDPAGETLAHSPRAMPVFNLTLPRAVKALLQRFPADTLQPGDMLVTNDPWLCAGHLFDVAIVSPVFRGGRVVALVGTVGHVADIGGTRDSLRAREIFDEGLQIPPMKIARAGVDNEDLFLLIAENVRNPDQVVGDIQAFMAANRIGAQRLTASRAELSPAMLVLFVLYAAFAALVHELIVGLAAMHSGWFPAFAVALITLIIGMLIGFPPVSLALLVGFSAATGPAFADMGYDLKAGFMLRGDGADPAFEADGRWQQYLAAMFAFVVAGLVVVFSYQSYFAANLVAPVARVYVTTIKAGAAPGVAGQLLLWAIPGALLQLVGGPKRQLGVLFATGMLILFPMAGWAVLAGVLVRLIYGQVRGPAAQSEMEVFAGGVIAGDALTGFFNGVASSLRRK